MQSKVLSHLQCWLPQELRSPKHHGDQQHSQCAICLVGQWPYTIMDRDTCHDLHLQDDCCLCSHEVSSHSASPGPRPLVRLTPKDGLKICSLPRCLILSSIIKFYCFSHQCLCCPSAAHRWMSLKGLIQQICCLHLHVTINLDCQGHCRQG